MYQKGLLTMCERVEPVRPPNPQGSMLLRPYDVIQ